MNAKAALLTAAALLLAVPFALAQAPARIEPRADEVLRKMGAFLAGLKRFTVEAEETLDVVPKGRARRRLTNQRQISVERPSRFASQVKGDSPHRASFFDGRTLSVLNTKQNVYMSLDAGTTIDGVLDMLSGIHGIELPLSDFLYSDVYASLVDGVVYGEYLGIHEADGVACHHVAFAQEDQQWQVWVDAGEKPLPRRFVIAYVDEPGVPQYEARFRRWTLDPSLAPETFRFKPPAGARKVETFEFLSAGR